MCRSPSARHIREFARKRFMGTCNDPMKAQFAVACGEVITREVPVHEADLSLSRAIVWRLLIRS